MVKITEIIDFLNNLAPKEIAESYDNVGLLVDSEKQEIDKVLLTLDTDFSVGEEAKEVGAKMIISHHPLIFNPIKKVTASTETGRTIRSLVKNDIALFAMHTNLDSVYGGLCDFLAEKIFDIKDFVNFEGEADDGIGRIVKLEEGITLKKLCDKIKSSLGINYLRVVGEDDIIIKSAAIVGGGGGSMTDEAASLGVDVYISGDFKYQHGRDAKAVGLALVEITHYDAEIIFCEYLKRLLNEKFGDKISVAISDTNKNVWRTV